MPVKSATTTETDDNLRGLLRRIRDDPGAGAWAEWARRMIDEAARRMSPACEDSRTADADQR